jgi:hypothetical protein
VAQGAKMEILTDTGCSSFVEEKPPACHSESFAVILRDCDFFEVDCLGGWVKVEGKA